MDKRIEFELDDGRALIFNVTATAYNSWLNKNVPNNKIQPAHNFLMSVVDDESKDILRDLLKQPGAALVVLADVVEEYQPDINLTVKKSKAEPKKSAKTD